VRTTLAEEGTRRLLTALALTLSVAMMYYVRVADPDLWGHLLYGRLFLSSGGLPPDPYAYTAPNHPWIAHEYLAQVALHLSYALAGVVGLIVLKLVLGLVVVYGLYRAVRAYSSDPRVYAVPLLLSATLVGRFALFRPQTFTFAFLALFSWWAHEWHQGERRRLWPLLPLTTLWANVHGGFVAGPGLLGLMGGADLLVGIAQCRGSAARRRGMILILVAAGSFALSLINPYGPRLWRLLLEELSNPWNRRFIVEWQPFQWERFGWSWGITLGMMALVMLAWLGAGPERDWRMPLVVVPVAAMAFYSGRHMPVFGIIVAPYLANTLVSFQRRWRGSAVGRYGLLLAMALALFPAITTLYALLLSPAPRIAVTTDSLGAEQPVGAIAFLRANGLTGNVFNPLQWGSLISWELGPSVRVSMDGRNDTRFPVPMVGENLRYFLGLEAELADVPLRYPTDFVLSPASSPVNSMLVQDTRWQRIYADNEAVLFVRHDARHAQIITRAEEGRLLQPPFVRKQFFP